MSQLSVTTDNGVCHIRWNRPEKKNALTVQMYADANAALAAAAADKTVRCVLFSGEGSAFTSGNDLMDFMANPPTGSDSPVLVFLQTLVAFEKPIVAAVHGAAVGIGVTMLMHCDLVYVARSSMLKMPFVPLGMVPEGGSSLLLPRMAGHARAAELLMLGEAFTAQTAFEVGIATRVVDDAEVHTVARASADKVAGLAPEAVKLSKMLMKQPYRAELEHVILSEGAVFVERLSSPEAMEAMQAFFEKRAPNFAQFN